MSFSEMLFHQKLLIQYPTQVLDIYPWPEAFCIYPSKIKAIVLGCDPTNTHTKSMPFVFGFHSPHKEAPKFFSGIEENLQQIGLDHTCVYIQNLCRNYFDQESSDNKVWKEVAQLWIPRLKEELHNLPDERPVFLTSELLYKVLLNEGLKPYSASELYSNLELTPIPAKDNRLNLPLLPLYRHHEYKLDLEKWEGYRTKLMNYVI